MSLLDTHESFRLLIYKFLSKSIGLPLAENTEYIIYRARLAAYETDRLKVSLKNLEKMLVFIEDRGFYKHSGISYKSLIRGALGQLGFRRRSGGSTIIQQLIRTLFIRNLSMTMRRKFAELGMAPWFNQILSKQEILAIYLSSVRFERGKFGVVEAMKYYWGEPINSVSHAQAFFLIERVSNIKSRLLVNKIIETAKNAEEQGILSSDDLKEINELYINAVNKEKIIASKIEVTQLSKALNA